MSNGPRLSTVMVETAESVQDLWEIVSADGVITTDEDAAMDRAHADNVLLSSQFDELAKLTVTMLRRGANAESLRRRYVAAGPPPGPVLPAQTDTP